MGEYRDVVVFIDRQEAKLIHITAKVEDLEDPKDSGILALGRQFFAGRRHRHEIVPKESARHLDVPFKS